MIKLIKLPSYWKKEYDLIMEDIRFKEETREQDALCANKSTAHIIALLCKILYKLDNK